MQPSDYESPPLTTRPTKAPAQKFLYLNIYDMYCGQTGVQKERVNREREREREGRKEGRKEGIERGRKNQNRERRNCKRKHQWGIGMDIIECIFTLHGYVGICFVVSFCYV